MKHILYMPFLWIALVMIPLTACSGSLKVEEVPDDRNLIGQVVNFTVPVVYMELKEEEKDKYDQNTIKIGRILITEEECRYLYNRQGTHNIEKIKENMIFTIIESYWVRHDWFTREFASDYQQLILKDEQGNLSTTLRLILQDSNRPELAR